MIRAWQALKRERQLECLCLLRRVVDQGLGGWQTSVCYQLLDLLPEDRVPTSITSLLSVVRDGGAVLVGSLQLISGYPVYYLEPLLASLLL